MQGPQAVFSRLLVNTAGGRLKPCTSLYDISYKKKIHRTILELFKKQLPKCVFNIYFTEKTSVSLVVLQHSCFSDNSESMASSCFPASQTREKKHSTSMQ